jgi:HPt (histidine-containing phosphotransfer) domain-containing protein
MYVIEESKKEIPGLLYSTELYFKTLYESMRDDKSLLFELRDYALSFFPEKFMELENAVIENDCNLVDKIAHNIKGEVGYFPAAKVQNLALELELMGKDSNLSNAKNILSQMKIELAKMVYVLSQIKEE